MNKRVRLKKRRDERLRCGLELPTQARDVGGVHARDQLDLEAEAAERFAARARARKTRARAAAASCAALSRRSGDVGRARDFEREARAVARRGVGGGQSAVFLQRDGGVEDDGTVGTLYEPEQPGGERGARAEQQREEEPERDAARHPQHAARAHCAHQREVDRDVGRPRRVRIRGRSAFAPAPASARALRRCVARVAAKRALHSVEDWLNQSAKELSRSHLGVRRDEKEKEAEFPGVVRRNEPEQDAGERLEDYEEPEEDPVREPLLRQRAEQFARRDAVASPQ